MINEIITDKMLKTADQALHDLEVDRFIDNLKNGKGDAFIYNNDGDNYPDLEEGVRLLSDQDKARNTCGTQELILTEKELKHLLAGRRLEIPIYDWEYNLILTLQK